MQSNDQDKFCLGLKKKIENSFEQTGVKSTFKLDIGTIIRIPMCGVFHMLFW